MDTIVTDILPIIYVLLSLTIFALIFTGLKKFFPLVTLKKMKNKRCQTTNEQLDKQSQVNIECAKRTVRCQVRTYREDIHRRSRKCQVDIEQIEDLERGIKRCLFKELPYWRADSISKSKYKLIKEWKSAVSNVLRKKKNNEERTQERKKLDTLKQIYKEKVRFLKDEYKKEVTFIKNNEQGSETKKEKINTSTRVFRKKLKYIKVIYLLEMSKIKKMKQRDSGFRRKKGSNYVAVGCYSVSLPPICEEEF